MKITTLEDLSSNWKDAPAFHEKVIHDFGYAVLDNIELNSHRDWIEKNNYGYGHKSFHWVWYQLAKILPDNFKFLEIGVHKGQSLSAIDYSANLLNKNCTTYGVSPLNGAGGFEVIRDYYPDLELLFDKFNNKRYPKLIQGLSQDEEAKTKAAEDAPYDAVYIDGEHTYETTKADILYYSKLLKVGGYLLSDDSSVFLNLNASAFRGFEGSSLACDELLPPKSNNSEYRHVGNVMHLRIWQRI
jgi:hypothetical protein